MVKVRSASSLVPFFDTEPCRSTECSYTMVCPSCPRKRKRRLKNYMCGKPYHKAFKLSTTIYTLRRKLLVAQDKKWNETIKQIQAKITETQRQIDEYEDFETKNKLHSFIRSCRNYVEAISKLYDSKEKMSDLAGEEYSKLPFLAKDILTKFCEIAVDEKHQVLQEFFSFLLEIRSTISTWCGHVSKILKSSDSTTPSEILKNIEDLQKNFKDVLDNFDRYISEQTSDL